LTESENNETSSYNTKRLLCKKNLSTTDIGEMVMSINQLNRGNIYISSAIAY